MHTPDSHTDQRLTALEIKASFGEDLLDSLNLTVIAQQRRIDGLEQQIEALREQLRQSAPAGEGNGFRSLRDELPPHY